MTRRAHLLLLCFALPAFPQSDNEHGVSVGPTQIAYLVKPVEVSLPAAPPNQGDFADYARRAMALEQEALTNAGGAPVAFTLSGKQTILAPKTPVPRVAFEAWSERLSRNYQEGVLTGFSSFEWESNRTIIHRFVRDNFRHVEIRYSLTVETLPNSYRLTFHADPDSTAPQFPVPQILQDGDTLALDLYVEGVTGQKLVDYIHVLYQAPLHLRKEPARDSYSDDAELAISQPKLRANGLALDPGRIPEALHGQTLSVYIPGHGAFILSLKPHPGYELAGEVSGNLLTFTSAGNLFRIECSDRIASAGSATYNLYVLRDTSAAPPPDPARFLIASVQP
jgi:hypothetical protein